MNKKYTFAGLLFLLAPAFSFAESLTVKFWGECQQLANKQIEQQAQALKDAEQNMINKIEEAQAFSDEQSETIDDQRQQIEELKLKILALEKKAEKETKKSNQLDIQMHKLQASFDISVNNLDDLKVSYSVLVEENKGLLKDSAEMRGKLIVYEKI